MALLDRVFVFDLDGTLYPSTVGTEKQIIPALLRVVGASLGTDGHETRQIVHDLNRRYGYCVRGLTAERHIDPSELVERIYAEIDIDQVVVNEALSAALCELSRFGHIAILTNSSRGHADKILRRLSIRDHVSTIIGIQDLEYFEAVIK